MDTIVIKEIKKAPKPVQKEAVIPLKKRGLLGILKGKIHCDDAVFNLD